MLNIEYPASSIEHLASILNPMQFKLKLKFKFVLFTSLLILIIGVGSGIYFTIQSINLFENELKKRGLSFVVQFAMDEEVRDAIYLEQPAFLDAPIKRLRELDVEHELVYCRVLLPPGRVLREEREDGVKMDIGKVSDLRNLSQIRTPQINRFIIKSQASSSGGREVIRPDAARRGRLRESFFYDFLSPVFEKPGLSEEVFARFLDSAENIKESKALGYVQIGLSSAQINKKLWNVLLTGIIPLSIATIVGGFGVSYFIARKIVAPIEQLVKLAAKVAKGELEYMVDVKSRDEIGMLADSFNQMTKELKLQMDGREDAMEQLKEVNIKLEDSNKELIRTNEQLNEAQDQIIRSEKLAAVGQLASSVAHELRNPIGAIKNSIFYVKRQINKMLHPDNTLLQFLDIMDNETERGNKIISDLLGFTQTSMPAVAPARLRPVIEETLSRIRPPDGVKTAIDCDIALPEVLIDSAQIGQVFFNIIQNGYQAMPDGGELKITSGCDGEFVKVQFADTGPGIPKKIINKIFDPLFTTKTNGIGLGLAFSYSVIQRHGGKIAVSSEEGKGAVFTVSLPRRRGQGAEDKVEGWFQ